MNLQNNLPEQITISYVDPSKYKRSRTALYSSSNGVIYIVDECNQVAEVHRLNTAGISNTGMKTRDIATSDMVRCGLGTTITITQE